MANVQRRPILLPLIGLACLPVAALASQLRVRGTSGDVQSTIELASARYDVTQKRVVVTTRAGNFVCAGGQAATSGQLGLSVDGTSYAISADPPGQQQDMPVVIEPAGANASSYTLAVPGASGQVGCASSNQTAANLKLAFENGAPLTIAEAVYFDLASRTFDIRITDHLLCNSYAANAAGLSIRLVEANGVADVLSGFERVDYELSGSLLRARSQVNGDSGGNQVQCFTFNDAPGAPGASPSGGDTIFASHFEYDDVAADLRVTSSPATLSVLAEGNQAFQYTITVENVGNGVATGVRVREYLPSLAAGTLSAGNWSCARYVGNDPTPLACADLPPSQNGVLNHINPSLADGERLVYTLNRSISGVDAGTQLVLGGAAFVNPTPQTQLGRHERNYADNSTRLALGLVANQPPTFSAPVVLAHEDGDAADPQDPTAASTGQTIPLTFTDSDSSALTITSVTTNGGAGLPPTLAAPTVTGTAPNFSADLIVPPTAKDKSGSVVITVNLSDGSTTSARTISYDVLARNDTPDFTLSATDVAVPSCTAPCAEVLRTQFASALLPGPATATDEATQSAIVTGLDASGRIACSNVPAGFFDRNENPRLIQSGNGYNLSFYPAAVNGQATCEISVIDNGSPAGTRTRSFTITYPAPP